MRYLRPYDQTNSIAETPLLSDDFSLKNPLRWPVKVNFPGWRKPQSNWSNWVEKLSLKYARFWEQTGICDAILSSLFEIKPNPEIVLGLCEFWCPKTNTFIFPWGEATITLEDVMILAGLPVLGEPVNLPLLGDSMKILEGKLSRVRSDVSKCGNARRASYSAWVNFFNEGGEGVESFENVGFLAYWLSRFVFPDLSTRTLGRHVFPMAVRLSVGVKVALAPAVLACLYQNLTFLAQNAADCSSLKREVSVPGPFWIVQIWALERFPLLGLKLAKPLSLGQPRAARWDKLVLKESLVDVRSILRSGDGFQWRPYTRDLRNWCHRSFYPVKELMVPDCAALDDEELKSFCLCLHPHQLVGIDCAEMYRPQRVAMQFGYDQDLPGECAVLSALESQKGSMFVPSRFSQQRMSRRYKNWWKESISDHRDMASEGLQQEGTDYLKPMLRNDVVMSDMNCECEFMPQGLEKEGSSHNQSKLKHDNVKSSLNYEGECPPKGLEQEGDDHKRRTRSNDPVKSDLNCEEECFLKGLQQVATDHGKPTLNDDMKHSGITPEVECLSEGLEQEDIDSKNSTLTDNFVKRDFDCEGEHVPNAGETSTPSEILNVSTDGNDTGRKFCAVKEDWGSKTILFVDVDEEEATNLGEKYGDQSNNSTKQMKRRGGRSADNSWYISDHCKKVSKKPRKIGISLQNPIDVENYYF